MAVLAPSSSGLGRRPLKAVARVRIPSGLQRSAVRGHHDAGRFRFRRRSSRAAVASLTGLGVFHTLGQSLPASAGLLAPCPCGPPPGRCLRAGFPGSACVPAFRAPPACRPSGLRLLGGLRDFACVPAFRAPPARRLPDRACLPAIRPRLLASLPDPICLATSRPGLPGGLPDPVRVAASGPVCWRPSGPSLLGGLWPGLLGGLRARLLSGLSDGAFLPPLARRPLASTASA